MASFPLPGPGAFTSINGFVVSIYGIFPYPSSLTIVSTSVGYPFLIVWIYVLIPIRFNFFINLSTDIWLLYKVTTTLFTENPIFFDLLINFIISLS